MFVLYKENKIPEIGGVHPQGIEIGLATYKGWNLADCPIDKMHEYKEFNFIPIPKNVANGLRILDSIVDEDDGTPGETNFKLSQQDIKDKEEAEKFINKLNKKLQTRFKISEITDLEDDLTDLKRLAQSLVMFVVDDWKNKPTEQQEKSKFKEIIPQLEEVMKENIHILPSFEKDLEKIESIIRKEMDISEIVKTFYKNEEGEQ